MMNKKGSLELSIQAIIIIVIAFVVLGLGLGFVRTQFKSITETSSSVQEQVRQQVLEDLRTGNKPLSFPATTLNINLNDATDIAVGVKNTQPIELLEYNVKLTVTCKSGDEPCLPPYTAVDFFYDKSTVYKLNVGAEPNIHPIKIIAREKGTYLVKLEIIKTDASNYAEKTFFVNIV